MALSHQQRDQIERRVRAAIDRLLAGQIPPGGACDVKTLAREAGISRASLYRTWGHLKDEFEKRRAAAWAAGQQPDPREARIARLRDLNQRLTSKLARTHTSSPSSRSVTGTCCRSWRPRTTSCSVCVASSVRSIRSRTKGRGTTPRASSPCPGASTR
ncbi:hypothetical protein GCM10010103_65220 [Streptomyces paradoxus]|uniref:Uncharacterized protein n=1 Tax=Streptomyces paradoxus TaxID=66375 RepID=A0A7W9WKU8_9ACTN|nr:hypothetical protein [Streptomyces paradoxus]MBB6081066.1 hypothetical protein [Streptomyces paradoxus]